MFVESTHREVTVTVVFSEIEAEILKGLIQNSPTMDEPQEVTRFRETLWDALTKEGINVR